MSMLQIDDTVISLDIFEKYFRCDLQKCKGHCCVFGDSGAPLEDGEVRLLEMLYPRIKPYLRPEGIHAIERQGTSIIDADGDRVTPLITDKECAYTIMDGNIYFCGIEKAYLEKKIRFQKPLSCHLFPIKTKSYNDFTGLHYEQWKICQPGRECGQQEPLPLYKFLKDALIRKFGKSWYRKVWIAGEEIFSQNQKTNTL